MCMFMFQVGNGCQFFGVAHDVPDLKEEEKWTPIVKSGYQIEVPQADGTHSMVDCDESETIRQAIIDGVAPSGVYIGGQNYKLTEVVSF